MKNVEFSRGLVVPLMKRNMIDARTFNFRDNLQSSRPLITRKMFWCWPQFLILLLWNIKLYIITGDRSESEKMKMHIQNIPGSHDNAENL